MHFIGLRGGLSLVELHARQESGRISCSHTFYYKKQPNYSLRMGWGYLQGVRILRIYWLKYAEWSEAGNQKLLPSLLWRVRLTRTELQKEDGARS